jgi:hypothetical protein
MTLAIAIPHVNEKLQHLSIAGIVAAGSIGLGGHPLCSDESHAKANSRNAEGVYSDTPK